MTDVAIAETADRYALAQRVLHWLIAALVLGSLFGGALLWAYGFEGLQATFGLDATNAIYKYHKTAGVLILGLMLARLALRLAFGAPQPLASMSPQVWTIARATHLTFYVLLLVMPVLGWAATAAGGFPVQFFEWNLPGLVPENEALSGVLYRLHGIVGVAIGLLALVHIAGALRHRFLLKDRVMERIALP